MTTDNKDNKAIAQRVSSIECEIADVADAIGAYRAIDFDLIDDDLAAGMKAVLLQGEEAILRKAAEDLETIFEELTKE